MTNAHNWLQSAIEAFEQRADPETAAGQAAYMRHQFQFFGLKSPVWKSVAKDLLKRLGPLDGEALDEFCRAAYARPPRELHYLAVFLLERALPRLQPRDVQLIEYLIVHNSWWDTVDWLAKIAGRHFVRFPDSRLPVTQRWIYSNNMWLQRSAILFQLTYGPKTDFELLGRYILAVMPTDEFFLQKAAGWALRQYARHAPEVVRDFLGQHPELPPLTRREAAKHLG